MQILIEIPEEKYNTIKNKMYCGIYDAEVYESIVNGTPLPKGHGRLIDADALEGHSQIQIVPCGNGKYVEVMTYYQNDIDAALTIIPADKESEIWNGYHGQTIQPKGMFDKIWNDAEENGGEI